MKSARERQGAEQPQRGRVIHIIAGGAGGRFVVKKRSSVGKSRQIWTRQKTGIAQQTARRRGGIFDRKKGESSGNVVFQTLVTLNLRRSLGRAGVDGLLFARAGRCRYFLAAELALLPKHFSAGETTMIRTN